MIWYDCPHCGAPQSSDGEHFCGKCEARYQEWQAESVKWQIEELQKDIANCPCRANGVEEGCMKCTRRYAHILSLQGKEAEAESLLNQ